MTAGLGTRLRPFTDLCPKPLLPLLGVPLAEFALDALAEAGVKRVVANVHHLPRVLESGLSALVGRDVHGASAALSLAFSDERAAILGSAGGIHHALPKLGAGAFFYVNGDMLWSLDLNALASTHARLRASHGVTLTLGLLPGRRTGAYREIGLDPDAVTRKDPGGLILGAGEVVAGKPFFAGIAVLEREAVESLHHGVASDFLQAILKPAIASQRAGYHLWGADAGSGIDSALWFDIGTPGHWHETHFEVERLIKSGQCPRGWQGKIAAARASGGFTLSERPARVIYGDLPAGAQGAGIAFGGHWIAVG